MKFFSTALAVVGASASFASASVLPRQLAAKIPVEGDITFAVPGTNLTANTHFWAYGLTKRARPVVVLHGGPGIPSNYLTPLIDLAKYMPVIIYDQIGSGTSSHFPDTIGDTSFWTEDLFLAELRNLLKKLHIENDYSIYGHSWGGVLGARLASEEPATGGGLKKLVLASTPASIPLWLESANYLRTQLPQEYQDVLDKHEADETTDDPEYLAAVQYFYDLHVIRVLPNPEDVQASFAGLGQDPTVYLTM